MNEKPRKSRKKNKFDEAVKVVSEAYALSDRLVEYVRSNPGAREACLLIMAIELWKHAVVNHKIDAVAMGMYGMQHFFESAPEDCGRLGMSLSESPDGEIGIAIFPKDGSDDGGGKTELR